MYVTTRLGRRLTHRSIALAIVVVALQAAPAHAAPPAAPVITGPSGTSDPAVELTWSSVGSATLYEVKVDNNSDFMTPEWSSNTVSTVSIPTKMLAQGQQNIQVRAKNAGNEFSAPATSTFTVVAGPGPTLTSPDDGAHLAQPADPPLLVWTPLAGAALYTVELDTESAFISPPTYTTKGNAFVVPDNQAPGVEYFWRVRATLSDGVSTDYSSSRTYNVDPIDTPAITGPPDTVDVTDVMLDWDPVPGAKYYELEVDDDFDFSTPVTGVPEEIYSTRFSPKVTFGNDQYYWRVRAVDLDNNPTDWVHLAPDVHYAFDRVWRDVPELVHPYDASGDIQFVENDLYYEWEPVPHATQYEVWLSTDPNFTDPSPVTWKCITAGTTYTPGELGDSCMPRTEGLEYYWKVRALDLPRGIQGIFSATQLFVYNDQDAFNIQTPQPFATVQIPTLDWAPVPGTETYVVRLLNKDGAVISSATTRSTSYTPMDQKLVATDNTFRWEISARDEDGRTTTIVRRSFTFSEDPLDTSTPLEPAASPPTYDAPNLRWGAVAGANYYRIEIGSAATGNWFLPGYAPILSSRFFYPAATDISAAFLNEGTYNWRAVAYDENSVQLDVGPISTFTILALGPVTGQRLALTGSSLDLPGGACIATLTDSGAMCEGVPATPVLDWDPVPYSAKYRVWISRDGDFTSGSLTNSPPSTTNTRWTPRIAYVKDALEDSQAQTPYYWFIQPCKSSTQCGPSPISMINPARHAFKKTSPRIELLSPADNPAPADPVLAIDTTEVTFEWEDYLTTNLATTYAETGEVGVQAAKSYEFQIDNQPTFASPIETVVVDQPTYTSADKLYPEGPLYWRVQPIDAADNRLGWTPYRTVVKSSPKPALLSPIVAPGGSTVPEVSGSEPFRWEPEAFSASYEIQVAANADRNFSSVNLRVNKSSKRPAFTTGTSGQSTLQASASAYVWRVRRVDPLGNAGPWSEIGEFKVALSQPSLVAPAADAVVGTRNVVMRWSPVTESVKYRLEYRQVGGSTTVVTTPATAFAPTTALVAGKTYEWRVASVDADGRFTAPDTWRQFTVGGLPTATVGASIQGSGNFQTTLTAVPPTWNVPGVSDSYQWTRDGVAIPGATGATYDVTADDVPRSIRVVVTGTSPEFGTGTSTSAPVVGKAGPGPVATSTPQVSGTGRVGSVLTSTDPTWDPANTVATRQWLRDAAPISGATGTTYTVAASDVNAAISLRVTGTLPGRELTLTVSNAITAALGPAVSATAPPTITGTTQVGKTLTSVSPSWDQTGVQETKQWLRDGQPITGATATTYVVKAADLGTSLSVSYTGRLAGRADGIATSAAVGPVAAAPTTGPTPTPAPNPTPTTTPTPNPTPTTPAKVTSTITLKMAKSIAAGKKAVVKLKVTAKGIASPTGKITIMAGKKVIGKLTLKAGANGAGQVKIAKLKAGRYKVTAVYAGAGTVVGSTSKIRAVKVVG